MKFKVKQVRLKMSGATPSMDMLVMKIKDWVDF
jgi:hypothetical protein